MAVSLSGIAGNLTIVLLYVLTRTHGVPLGPHARQMEDVGALDLTATTAELGIILALLMLLDRSYRRVVVNALLVLGAVIWLLRLTGTII